MAPSSPKESSVSNQTGRKSRQGQQTQDPAVELLVSQMRQNEPRRVEVTEISDMNFPKADIPPESEIRVISVREIDSDVRTRFRPHMEKRDECNCGWYIYASSVCGCPDGRRFKHCCGMMVQDGPGSFRPTKFCCTPGRKIYVENVQVDVRCPTCEDKRRGR